MSALVHATCVVVEDYGLLLRGPSGSGKSTLALRLIDQGATLVGDDYCEYHTDNGTLVARPKTALAGLLEVRGIGIVTLPHRQESPIHMLFDMVPLARQERLPQLGKSDVAGVPLPSFCVDPFDVSAPAKIRLAIKLATGRVRTIA